MKDEDQDKVAFKLLENGLDFIVSALDHLSGSPTKRDLKYAVLHLSSGMELVLKERLQREHWSLVFDDPDNAQKETYETGDFTSVSFKACLKRLTGICGVKISDKHRNELLAFRNKRNRLEHFGILDSVEAITAAAARALSFLIDFISSELHPENLGPGDVATLKNIRQRLSEFEAFVVKRWKGIKKGLEHVKTAVVTCPSCTQDACVLDDGATCRFCGYQRSAEEAASDYISGVLSEDYYRTVKHGGEWPLYSCPECECEALVDQGPSDSQFPHEQFICFACGEVWMEGQLASCTYCGQLYESEHGEGLICRECFVAQLKADD